MGYEWDYLSGLLFPLPYLHATELNLPVVLIGLTQIVEIQWIYFLCPVILPGILCQWHLKSSLNIFVMCKIAVLLIEYPPPFFFSIMKISSVQSKDTTGV